MVKVCWFDENGEPQMMEFEDDEEIPQLEVVGYMILPSGAKVAKCKMRDD